MALRKPIFAVPGGSQQVASTDQIAFDAGATTIRSNAAGVTRLVGAKLGDVATSFDFIDPQFHAAIQAGTLLDGDFSANLTAACAQVGGAGTLEVLPGLYGVANEVILAAPINMRFRTGAWLRQTLGFANGDNRGMLRLLPGAASSVLAFDRNAGLDGNRDNLVSAYCALDRIGNNVVPGQDRYAIKWSWHGIWFDQCDNLTVTGLNAKNIMVAPLAGLSGSNPTFRDIRIKNSTKMIGTQSHIGGTIESIYGQDISNMAYPQGMPNGMPIPFYQYAVETRLNKGTTFRDIHMRGYNFFVKDNNGVDIGEPNGGFFVAEQCEDCTFDDILGTGVQWGSSDTRQGQVTTGFGLSYCLNNKINALGMIGFYAPFSATSSTGKIASCLFDGANNSTPASGFALPGIRFTNGGILPTKDGLVASDARLQIGCDFDISDTVVKRSSVGIQMLCGNLRFTNTNSLANTIYGWQAIAAEPNISFPATTPCRVERIRLYGCSASYNGQSGFHNGGGIDVASYGGDFKNNGQLTSDASLASGLSSLGGNPDRFDVFGGVVADDQAFTFLKYASYAPGSTDAKNRKDVLFAKADRIREGQHVFIVDALSPGNYLYTRIVAMQNELATCEFQSAATFTANANNIYAISGTAGLSSAYVTGVGTSFTTQITGPTFIRIGASQYFRVRKIVDDTHLYVEATPDVVIAPGAALALLQCTVVGIPSQRKPLYLNSGATNVQFSPSSVYGHVVDDIPYAADAGSILPLGTSVGIKVGAKKVVGPQQAAISDGLTDTQKIAATLAALRAHGLIAP
jgi:hypothetical protein